MNVSSDAPRRYRIVFRGECSSVFEGFVNDAAVEYRDGYTWLVATVRDNSEFYGLLDRFQDLALLPVSINELGATARAPGEPDTGI
jgi:hypothetical protein